MTVEEIKATTEMKDILPKYGLKPNRSGMISCPFHGKDQHPSMKIFADGFKCFTCGEAGDIFKFVQLMEGCDFKTSFKILGGQYEHSSNAERTIRNNKFIRERKEREAQERAADEFKRMLSGTITILRTAIEVCEPMSDMWCDAQHYLPEILWIWEEKYINGGEVEELNVYRKCKSIRQRFLG